MARFYPDEYVKKVLSKRFLTQDVPITKDFNLRKSARNALRLARLKSGQPIEEEAIIRTLNGYEKKYEVLLQSGASKAEAFDEAVNGGALLKQRIINAVIYDGVQTQKQAHEGQFYRWLPSDAQNPDPEHQLLYGKVFRVGTGDKDGNMPGERYGCRCGIEWLSEEEAFKEFAGKEWTGYKGQKAVRKLIKEQEGYVPNAFYRKDIGSIDLMWGDETRGLSHILTRRNNQGINAMDFIKNLSTVIKQGRISVNKKGRFEILYKGKMAVIDTEIMGKKKNYVLTAFKTRKK